MLWDTGIRHFVKAECVDWDREALVQMTHYYCSIASNDYGYKVLALYNSMVKHDKDFIIFIICMNDEIFALLEALKPANAELIRLKEIEAFYPKLAEAGKARNDKEYAWTIKPSAFLYVFKKYDYCDHVLWLDGDTFFLSDPGPIYSEWDSHKILLTEERYSGKYEFMSHTYGIYNTGLLGFKRDDNSFECIEWLQSKVNEWCYDKAENGLWSDQMYVNDWPQRFKGVKIIKNPGINMTPFVLWRLTKEEKSQTVRYGDDIFINNNRLVLFHYYGFKYRDKGVWDLCSYKNWGFSKNIVQAVYKPYISACETAIRMLNNEKARIYKTEVTTDKCNPICNFCTITTPEYLPKCLALITSLEKHAADFRLFICCMDINTHKLLSQMQLKNVTLVELSEIENSSLISVKEGRKINEYCWTLKPSFIQYIFNHYKNADSLLYVDSDVCLFSKPRQCFKALENYPVFLTCHNFSQSFKHLYKGKGRFNAGIIGFKRCAISEIYLKWWHKKCIEWCYDIVSAGRFADQKYLEEFTRMRGRAYEAESVGLNAALWNMEDAEIEVENDSIYINGSLLVFYHFSGFPMPGESRFDSLMRKQITEGDLFAELIYIPYGEALQESIRAINPYIEKV